MNSRRLLIFILAGAFLTVPFIRPAIASNEEKWTGGGGDTSTESWDGSTKRKPPVADLFPPPSFEPNDAGTFRHPADIDILDMTETVPILQTVVRVLGFINLF